MFFFIRIINTENIGVDNRIMIQFQLQLEAQDFNTNFWILGYNQSYNIFFTRCQQNNLVFNIQYIDIVILSKQNIVM